MAGSNRDWESPDMDDEEQLEDDVPVITIADETGRTLACTIEHSLEVDNQDYVLLLPVDSPVEIFAWQEDGEEDEAIPVEDEAEIDAIFPTAKVVLEEQNLILKRTAVTLTVQGDLPDLIDEDEFLGTEEDEDEDEEYEEELQLLARFYHEEQEYAVYTPLDPFFIFARLDDQGQPHLLSQEEFKKIEPMLPMLEDQLFDALE